jgi:hypothetical protein
MKKLGIALLIVIGCVFVCKKTHLGSYLRTAWAKVKQGAKDQVPVEFEIERVAQQIDKMDVDIDNLKSQIAEEKATIMDLEKENRVLRAHLASEKADILVMTKALDGGQEEVSFRGVEYSREDLADKLEQKFPAYKAGEARLKRKMLILETKRKAMKTRLAQLTKMRSLKNEWKARLEKLKAEVEEVRLAKAYDQYQVDETRMSDIKNSFKELEHWVNVQKAKLELNGQRTDDLTPSKKKAKSVTSLTKDVKSYFGEKTEKEETVVQGKK